MRVFSRRADIARQAAPASKSTLSITGKATHALKVVLDGLDHQPHEMLRTSADLKGHITLALDSATAGDNVVSHEGFPVLLVGPVLPQALRGKTLDISESYEGTQIVINN